MGRRIWKDDYPSPEILLAKQQLIKRIAKVIRDRQFTQWHASVVMHVDQPQVSHILSGRASVSIQRLLEFLNALGQDVEIVIRKAPPKQRRGTLHVAD